MIGKTNIIITGFMGTGKTSVGRYLARLTGKKFIDTDREIERVTGLSAAQIFSRCGEEYFRREETKAIRRACSFSDCVIATGGGAVLKEENFFLMKKNGILIALYASPEEIKRRLKNDKTRPLLKDNSVERIKLMLAEREPFYRRADIGIDTSGYSYKEVAQRILTELEKGVKDDASQDLSRGSGRPGV